MFTPSPTPEEKSEDRSCRSDSGAESTSPLKRDHRITVGMIRAAWARIHSELGFLAHAIHV